MGVRHLELIARAIERIVKDTKNVDVPAVLKLVGDPILLVKEDAHMPR